MSSPCVAQAGLRCAILLPQSPRQGHSSLQLSLFVLFNKQCLIMLSSLTLDSSHPSASASLVARTTVLSQRLWWHFLFLMVFFFHCFFFPALYHHSFSQSPGVGWRLPGKVGAGGQVQGLRISDSCRRVRAAIIAVCVPPLLPCASLCSTNHRSVAESRCRAHAFLCRYSGTKEADHHSSAVPLTGSELPASAPNSLVLFRVVFPTVRSPHKHVFRPSPVLDSGLGV